MYMIPVEARRISSKLDFYCDVYLSILLLQKGPRNTKLVHGSIVQSLKTFVYVMYYPDSVLAFIHLH